MPMLLILLVIPVVLGTARMVPLKDGDVSLIACRDSPVDIGLIIDSSRRINPLDFKRQIDFLVEFVSLFDIHPNKVRVAAVSFGQRVIGRGDFTFNKYNNTKEVQDGLRRFEYPGENFGGGKNTTLGIAFVRDRIFRKSHPEAKKLFIVLIDGRSTDPRNNEEDAALIKSENVQTVAIGIGTQITMEVLKGIASRSDDFVFTVNNHSRLETIKKKMILKICTDTPGHKSDEPEYICSDSPVDIGLIIYSSRSIRPFEFMTQIEFLVEFVSLFDIHPNKVRVAAVSFGPQVLRRGGFIFTKYNNTKKVQDGLRRIKYRGENYGGGPNTTFDIAFVRNRLFRKARPEAKKLFIVLTDGPSTDPQNNLEAAALIKSENVQMVAIGFGPRISMEELKGIASSTVFVFTVDNYFQLETIKKKMILKICPDLPVQKSDEPEYICSDSPVDIGLIIYSSRSIRRFEFMTQIEFLVEFVSHFDIHPNKVRVAAVSFGPQVMRRGGFIFNKYINMKEVQDGLRRIKYQGENYGGGTNTTFDIAFVRNRLFRKARTEAKKLFIVLTDGPSTDPQNNLEAAALIKSENVQMVAIGFGPRISMEELKGIASSSISVFTVDNYFQLETIKKKMILKICPE